ncbi:MAG: hypothetical protein RBS80_00360 [Thermoguttaceae bacterium]|jgi:hypothetical protein|nr:hypothetical protein [Thermoguttaceae bacterium]
MNRRHFLAAGLGSAMAATVTKVRSETETPDGRQPQQEPAGNGAAPDPAATKLVVKPVMTNIIHTAEWEGPCRWRSVPVEEEKGHTERSFAAWSKDLAQNGLGNPDDVQLLPPGHVRFAEDFVLRKDDLEQVARDVGQADALFIHPSGSSVAAFQLGEQFDKPIILRGLNCRVVDIAAYTRSKGREAFVAADSAEMARMLSLLRARKVFRQTRVLFPTDRGLPASCSVGSIWCLDGLKEKLGVEVELITYKELAAEMDRLAADADAAQAAEQAADELMRQADRSFLDRKYVACSFRFHQAVEILMARHGCNAFTIECFELCSSRLAEKWTITPCLVHALMQNGRRASSCEGDLGLLLAIRMLMSVSGKSCHQGNSDPRTADAFRINHSAPSMKMAGFDQPDMRFQLGRFVQSGWGTKVVVDFMDHPERTVTVARVDPMAEKLLVLRGTLIGASGWDEDLIGCSVEAVIRPPEGRADEFLRKRLEFGNHLPWVYGDCTEALCELARMLKLEVDLIA